MPHLVLLGDSIFDNGFYVPGEPAVIEQLQAALATKVPHPRPLSFHERGEAEWQATLVAVDGNIVIDVARQLERLPSEATHLAISVGGNDALRHSTILGEAARNVGEVLRKLDEIQTEFQREYRTMLEAVVAHNLPTVVATIYDAIPGLPRKAVGALAFFNDVITREAARARVPLLDLRLLCRDSDDYSAISPIEPSAVGGAKIAAALARFFTTHDFSRRECVVFW